MRTQKSREIVTFMRVHELSKHGNVRFLALNFYFHGAQSQPRRVVMGIGAKQILCIIGGLEAKVEGIKLRIQIKCLEGFLFTLKVTPVQRSSF